MAKKPRIDAEQVESPAVEEVIKGMEVVPAETVAVAEQIAQPLVIVEGDVLSFELSVPNPETHESVLSATDQYGNSIILAMVGVPQTATETTIHRATITAIRGTLERILRSIRV